MDKLKYHTARNHPDAQSGHLVKEEPCDSDNEIFSDGVIRNPHVPSIRQPAVDQTPSPSRILSAVEKLFTETPFRSIPENPFCQAFRTGLALTPQNMTVSTDVPIPSSPSQLNPVLFAPLSPMFLASTGQLQENGGMMVFSPVGFTQATKNVVLPTTPGGAVLAAPATAGFALPAGLFSFVPGQGMPVQYYQLAQQPSVPAVKEESKVVIQPKIVLESKVAKIESAESRSPTVERPTVIDSSPSPIKPATPSVKIHLQSSIPEKRIKPTIESILAESNQKVRELLKRKMDEYLSENSETVSIASSTEYSSIAPSTTTVTAVSAQRKAARPILETDDPILADKRRRNRLAADKCRKKRKERHDTLEGSNQELQDKFNVLTAEYMKLTQFSKETIEELVTENRLLRQENEILKNRSEAVTAADAKKAQE